MKRFLIYPLMACAAFTIACSNDVESNNTQASTSVPIASLTPSKPNRVAAKMTEPQKAISKLGFLTGKWAGSGVSYDLSGNKTSYYDTEHVRFDLEKNLLLINARGENSDGDTTYSLHTIIYYDLKSQAYFYTPHSGDNTPRPFRCQLNDKPQFICLTDDETYRLTFQRLANGRWNEFGERLNEGVWMKSFETILLPQSP